MRVFVRSDASLSLCRRSYSCHTSGGFCFYSHPEIARARDASTSNGRVDFNLSNLTYTRNLATSKVAETEWLLLSPGKGPGDVRISNADVNVDEEN